MAFHLINVFETIMYEYAKLIADQAVEDRATLAPAERASHDYWSFVSLTFKKLRSGKILASSVLRENKKLVSAGTACGYCGIIGALQWEHIIPKSRGGPDLIDNIILSCAPCNREKAARNPIEWYAAQGKDRKNIPRLVMGKLLKVTLEEHRRQNSLLATEFPEGKGLHLYNVCLIFDGHEAKSKRPDAAIGDSS